MMTNRGVCSIRIIGTWRAATTTSSSPPTESITGWKSSLRRLSNDTGSRLGISQTLHRPVFQEAKHPIKGLLRQRDVFEKQVKPLLGEGKFAYVWVDALRFEMARELCLLLKDDFELGYSVCHRYDTHDNRDRHGGVIAEGSGVRQGGGHWGRQTGAGDWRQGHQGSQGSSSLSEGKCGRCGLRRQVGRPASEPAKKVKEGIQTAELILITSQEIDELGEADNMAQARLQIDGVLSHLRRGVRVLADHGIKSIVLVADHGHLFADEIGDDTKIEAPGGKVEDMHRRVWVGVGGNSEPSYLRTSLASLGVDSEFDIATPWTFAVFKSKGGGVEPIFMADCLHKN